MRPSTGSGSSRCPPSAAGCGWGVLRAPGPGRRGEPAGGVGCDGPVRRRDPLPGASQRGCVDDAGRSSVRRGAPTAAGPVGADEGRTAGASGTPGAVSRPHVSLLVAAETVAELLGPPAGAGRGGQRVPAARHHARTTLDGPAARRRHVGAGVGRCAVRAGTRDRLCAPIALPWGTVAPATLEDGTPVPMSELARVLCEADVTRIVMSAESLPLGRCGTVQAVVPTAAAVATAQRRAAVCGMGSASGTGATSTPPGARCTTSAGGTATRGPRRSATRRCCASTTTPRSTGST